MAAGQSVVGVYINRTGAEQAVQELVDNGYPADQVSLLAQQPEGKPEMHGEVHHHEIAKAGAVEGALVGGVFGLLIGAAFLWVPGFGLLFAAGPLAAALLGGLEGAVAGAALGGIMGAISEWGVTDQHVERYQELLRDGHYLVLAHGDDDQIKYANALLRNGAAIEVNYHGE